MCLIGGLLGGTGVGSSGSGSSGGATFSTGGSSSGGFLPTNSFSDENIAKFTIVFAIVICVVIALAIVYTIFVGNIITVGYNSFFIWAPSGNRDIGVLFSGFKKERYKSYLNTMFMTNLYIFLWSLLIIPGIIKSYEYRFVPYIIAENPELTPDEAMLMSKTMTDGHKMEMFILELSFFGWYFLGALMFGIGVLFVNPYVEATFAQLYFVLRGQYMQNQNAQMGYVQPQTYNNNQQNYYDEQQTYNNEPQSYNGDQQYDDSQTYSDEER